MGEMSMRSVSYSLTAAALGLSLLTLSTPASAAIVNIDASDSVGVEVSFDPGSYLIKWIGIADGGLYDAANVSFCNPGCSTGFSNAFVARDQYFGSADFEIQLFTTRTLYGSAADSLAAYKSGNAIYSDFVRFVNGSIFETGSEGLLPNPWIVTASQFETFKLVVLDGDGNRANNSGGVSLSIERIANAVPEPASWALMLAGFGLVGAAMRRRPSVTASFA
jgi:hypothetical protein